MAESWVLFAAAALLLRAGYALYLTGLSRSKNTVSTFFQSFIEIAVGILVFWAIGSPLLGAGSGYMGEPGFELFIASTFLIGPAVVSGAAMERARPIVGIIAVIIMPGLVIPLACRVLQWHWLRHHGFTDEAGATFIHFSAGVAAIVITILLGPRVGKYNRDGSTNAILGHNLPLAASGILLIFIMWPIYVTGFSFSEPQIALNTVLAASAGVVAASAYCAVRYARQDVFLVLTGLMGGLVSITAGANHITSIGAIAIGAVAGVAIPYAIVMLDLVWKIDDPASGIAVHGLGGLWSVLAIAVLAPGTFTERLGRLVMAVIALIIVAVLTLAIVGTAFIALRATIGLRCRESDEFDGLDLSYYDLNAYPDFQQTTIKSYHLREM
jgi:Amt family ammonium transporter